MTQIDAKFTLLVALCLVVALTSGCSWFGISEEQRALEEGASAPLILPETLDEPEYVDLMPIPDIVDYRGLGGRAFEVGLPESLATSFEIEQIIIRRLGDERWVFLDRPAAIIWPQMLLFFEDHGLPLSMQDAGTGTLITDWLVGGEGDADEIFDGLAASTEPAEEPLSPELSIAPFSTRYQFRVSVEPGVRAGSTELHVNQKQLPMDSPLAADVMDWSVASDNPELEGKLLNALAYYLGDRIAEGPSVSLLAAGLQGTKATLVTEASSMVLKYRLDFDRAWATVGAALEDAQISVDDLDRSSANYYVTYATGHGSSPGFIRRLLTSAKASDGGYKFRVHLEASSEEVHVTAFGEDNDFPEDDPARELLLSERLLKLIKEHST